MAARLVLAAGAVGLLLGLGLVLSDRAPRRAGTNLVSDPQFAAFLHRGQTVCQRREVIPADAAALRMTIATYGQTGPRVEVTVADARGAITGGTLAPGWHEGSVSLPVARVSQPRSGATVCLRDAGPATLALAGAIPRPPRPALTLDGRAQRGNLRIDYLRPHRETWWQLAPTVAHRFSLAKGGLVRGWAPWGALVLVVLTCALTLRALRRAALES